jgi:hypothetical protein
MANTHNPNSPLGRTTPVGLCRICANRHTFACPYYDDIRESAGAMEVLRCESFADEQYTKKPPNQE